jgi:hypothetical protein
MNIQKLKERIESLKKLERSEWARVCAIEDEMAPFKERKDAALTMWINADNKLKIAKLALEEAQEETAVQLTTP